TRTLRNLTNHPGGDFRPAWSADGRWIAFTTDRHSKNLRGASGFVVMQSTEIYVVRADGSELRRVTQAEMFEGSPNWSADGARLIFYEGELAEVAKIKTVRPTRGITQIVSLDLATNERRVLMQGPGEKWSPRFVHGERICYVSGDPEGGFEFI